MSLYGFETEDRGSATVRWLGAGILVVALHAGLGWCVLTRSWSPAELPDGGQGITIDLEPIAVPQSSSQPHPAMVAGRQAIPQSAAAPVPMLNPDPPIHDAPPPSPLTPIAPASEPPPAPIAATAEPQTPPTSIKPLSPDAVMPLGQLEPPVVTQPEPESIPSALLPSVSSIDSMPAPATALPTPEALPTAGVPSPQLAQLPLPEQPAAKVPEPVVAADAVLTPPTPKPALKPLKPQPDPREVARQAAERRAIAAQKEQQRAARAETHARAKAEQAAETRDSGGRADQNAAASGGASAQSIATWRGEVIAHLRAYKPSSPNGSSGTTRVAFSIDRAGRVVSASIAGSAGDGELDQAALSMVRRASPFPPPPPEMGGRVSFSVPVQFR